MRDTNPQVIRALLANPRLTEKDVVRIAALRPQNAANLREILRARRWSVRRSVRCALAWNPHTPGAIARRLLPLLDSADLAALAQEGPDDAIRCAAEAILRLRRTRDGPSEGRDEPDDTEGGAESGGGATEEG